MAERDLRTMSAILRRAAGTFLRIDGPQWARAFAYNAFFSLFPLIILFVTVGSFFIDRHRVTTTIIQYVEHYVPLSGKMQESIVQVMEGVVAAREQAGLIALVILTWSAIQCFITLTRATNHAWDHELENWWRIPQKGLALLVIAAGAVAIGLVLPVIASLVSSWVSPESLPGMLMWAVWSFAAPLVLVFGSLMLFYRYAPMARAAYREIWPSALLATLLLQLAQNLFVVYLKKFASLNAVYGTLGGVMALLLWMYLSGAIFIFGACLCAVRADAPPTSTPRAAVSA